MVSLSNTVLHSLLLLAPLAAQVQGAVVRIESDEELDELKSNNSRVVADFTTAWCGPCRLMEPVFKKYSNDFSNVVFASINIDNVPASREKYDILAVPTFITFMDGNEKRRLVGPNKPVLHEIIADLAS